MFFLFLFKIFFFVFLLLCDFVIESLFGKLRSKAVGFLNVTLDLGVFIVGQVVFNIEELLVHLDQRQESCAGVLWNPQPRGSPLLIGKLFRNSDHMEVVTGIVDSNRREESHEVMEGHPEPTVILISPAQTADVILVS